MNRVDLATSSRPGFLNLGAINIRVKSSFVWGVSVHQRMFTAPPAPAPVKSIPPSPPPPPPTVRKNHCSKAEVFNFGCILESPR